MTKHLTKITDLSKQEMCKYLRTQRICNANILTAAKTLLILKSKTIAMVLKNLR